MALPVEKKQCVFYQAIWLNTLESRRPMETRDQNPPHAVDGGADAEAQVEPRWSLDVFRGRPHFEGITPPENKKKLEQRKQQLG